MSVDTGRPLSGHGSRLRRGPRVQSGPVLYRARRAGLHGRPYTMHKLRTMHHREVRVGSRITATTDSGVFTAGRVLRRTKLDELPQLWDVLRGKMSVVGPRPEGGRAPDPGRGQLHRWPPGPDGAHYDRRRRDVKGERHGDRCGRDRDRRRRRCRGRRGPGPVRTGHARRRARPSGGIGSPRTDAQRYRHPHVRRGGELAGEPVTLARMRKAAQRRVLPHLYSIGDRVECPICGWTGGRFLPSNRRPNRSCPPATHSSVIACSTCSCSAGPGSSPAG